ncbi:MAG: C40 family peptidase [Nocardioidaceae bacterium]|nr:C40 family peptidase [Nocardioidaceae bacterium]
MTRRLLALALVALSRVLLPSAAHAAVPSVSAGHDAWVAVSVARLWESPSSPRTVDRPALERPVRVRAWLRDMSLAQRKALFSRSDTEALLGERVRVTRVRGSWAHVVVPDQPSPKDARGYPGWVPMRQLTARTPLASTQVATVVRRTAWLRTDDAAAAKVLEASFGTRLKVVSVLDGWVRVRTPLGATRRVSDTAVSVHAPGATALPRTRADLVTTAQSFHGLPYLWGGLSGFGLDCSGLTWLDFRAHGQTIRRDALPQSQHGTAVRRTTLRKGDLIFYATAGKVHHVTMYAGAGRMVEAPHTGAVVRTVPVRDHEYFRARRYLG